MVPTRAVIFDLDDTLIVEEAVARDSLRVAAGVAPDLASDKVVDVVLATARGAWQAGPHHRLCLELGIASWEGLWATFEGCNPRLDALRRWVPAYRARAWSTALSAMGIDDPAVSSAMAEAYAAAQRAGHPLIDGAAAVVHGLFGRVRLGLLTNGPADIQWLKLAQTGLTECFDAVGISGEAGVGKPFPDAFNQVLDRLDADPVDAIMVGDSWERDIEGAVGVGMSAIWLSGGRPCPATDMHPETRVVASISALVDMVPSICSA